MDLVQKLEDLLQLDTDVHWFCPRSTPDDHDIYYDEDFGGVPIKESDQEQTTRLARIHDAISRKEDALSSTRMLAYDGKDAEPYIVKIKEGLEKQLGRCDICIREFHQARPWLVTLLESEYPSNDVTEFMLKYDAMNNDRIVAGLKNMEETLLDLPPEERSIAAAGDVGMYAMFEALHCKPFLNNEVLLSSSFDKPFKLVQSKKKVILPTCAPGMVAFLFSSHEDRYSWAARNFTKLKRSILPTEFEHNVKPFLQPAAARVNVMSMERDFLPLFWRALRKIIDSSDHSLITNHLQAMDVNIYTLSLEHFQVDGLHFEDLIACYYMLLQRGMAQFWDSMGSITPVNVIETICKAPRLEQLLTAREDREHGQHVYLEEQIAWVDPLISSIKGANLVPPLRTLLDLFLHTYQGDTYSHSASLVTWEKGLAALLEGIKKILKEVDGGPVYTHLIEAVAKDHISVVLQELNGIEQKHSEVQIPHAQVLDLQIVELVLALDVKSLARDRRMIERTHELDHEIGVSSLNIWKLTMRHIRVGHPILVNAILSGITGLLPLEKLPPKQLINAPKQAETWNNALNRVHSHLIGGLFERLDAFEPDQLLDIFSEASSANGIMSLLFNGNDEIHQGALGVLKTLSGEDGRRESLMHILQVFFQTALSAASYSLKVISESRVFTPCNTMLKVCRDVLSCLCDTQDGLLRSKTLSANAELIALRMFWNRVWSGLETIFDKTEAWSSQGHDKQVMQEFCRETMDFADFAFEQYSIFAGILETSTENRRSTGLGKELLDLPNKAFKSIMKWLRLRDDYLIDKAVGLTSKILDRLHGVDIQVAPDCAQFIEDIVVYSDKHSRVRTKLTMTHKAALQEALERHLGEPLSKASEAEPLTQKKQSSLSQWASSESGSTSSSTSTSIPPGKSRSIIDLNAWSTVSEQKKSQDPAQKKQMQRLSGKAQQKAVQVQKEKQATFLEKRQAEKAAQEKQRLAAIARANQGAGSGVAGIGNYGKDQTTVGQTVMVDDDELDEDEDEDEDLDDDLFGSSIKPKRVSRPELDVNGATGLRPEVKKGPTRIQRTQRSKKDMRARLAPKLDDLHRIILGWDFFHIGDYPPGANQAEFHEVPNSFRDPVTYKDTFEPLLILEAWQGIVRAREENVSKPYEIKVGNRSNVDRFVEISSFLGHQENRDLQLMEGDIILFSKSLKPTTAADSPHCFARIYRVKRQKAHLEIVYQCLPNSTLAGQLTIHTIVHGVKIQSITPLEREYGALQALQYYDLCNQIVRAKPSARINFSERQISQAQDVYNLNRAQAEAVNAALENEGFSLIQGPPGSGKTKTITAIVGGLLSQTLNSQSNGASRITMPKNNSNPSEASDAPSKKLLVCAPSNAAVDELVMRLKTGVKTKTGNSHKIKVVRIGRSDAINAQVQDVTIDELVAKKLGGNENEAKSRAANAELFKEHEQLSARLREYYNQKAAHDNGEKTLEPSERKRLDEDISSTRRRKGELGARIDQVKDQERNAGREQELNRKRAQQAVLDEAHVICGTLSGSGHDMFRSLNIEFETVVIDEAAQCIEMSSLIPLKYGCIKCVMVGDPKQLPPTVFSKEAARFQYEQSLFVRMQNNHPNEVHLLDTQYRMHPDISVFPSRTFYDGLLKDGQGMAGLREQPWHTSALLAPYRFYDVRGQHQAAPKGHSLINMAEIDVAIALYQRLRQDYKEYDFTGKIGIITPYKSQLRELKNRFTTKFGEAISDDIEFNTTDAFQGRESEVIIFSCVRASPAGGIGFLQDIRRMNVGLTRAKSSLWVLGNSDSLIRGQYWKRLVEDAQSRDCYTTGDLLSMLQRPSSAFPAGKSNVRSMLDVNNHVAQMGSETSSRASSAYASRRPSVEAVKMETVKVKMERSQSPASFSTISNKRATPVNPDSMDGMQYRFEDRIKARKQQQPRLSPAFSIDQRPLAPVQLTEDVEMEDVAAEGTTNGREQASSHGDMSLDGASDKGESIAGRNGRHTQAHGAESKPPLRVAQQPRPPLLKKRPAAASPFIPKKPKPSQR